MNIAIMQPYFFPYIGYWQLIANTDEFIFFDVVQFNKKSWMSRNRVLHQDKTKDFQYISLPITKHSQGTLISELRINNMMEWQGKIISQLSVYRKLKAPLYKDVEELLNSIFSEKIDSFIEMIVRTVEYVCAYLDIEFKYRLASEIEFDRETIYGPGDWALQISVATGASMYINPPGGYEIFDEQKFIQNNIELQFLLPELTHYKQSWRKDFTPGLSLLDVMMFNDKKTVKEMLKNDFQLFSKQKLMKRIND